MNEAPHVGDPHDILESALLDAVDRVSAAHDGVGARGITPGNQRRHALRVLASCAQMLAVAARELEASIGRNEKGTRDP